MALALTLAGCTGATNPLAPWGVSHLVVDEQNHLWGLGAHNEVLKDGEPVYSPNYGGRVFQGYGLDIQKRQHQIYVQAQSDLTWWVWTGDRFEYVGELPA